MNRAAFFDRDGTLIEERNYLRDPEEVVLFPRAGSALRRLAGAGWKLILVTNQSGIGRGYFTEEDLYRVHERMAVLLSAEGVRLDRIYYAPEAPDQPSRGRKPSPQFLLDAAETSGLDLGRSVMVGDKLVDLECGWNAGVGRSILVRTGYGAETERQSAERLARAVVVDDLAAAVDWILGWAAADGEGGSPCR